MSRLRLRGTGSEYEVEVIVKALWGGVDVRSVPVAAGRRPNGPPAPTPRWRRRF